MPEFEENTEQTQEQTEQWDKDRQKIDQLSANVSKLASEKADVANQLNTMLERSQETQATVARLTEQLASAQSQQTSNDVLDADMYDEKLIKKISGLEAKLANAEKIMSESNSHIKELQTAKTQFETNAANEREAARKAERKELILTDLDREFGAKFRNEALKLAQAEVEQTGVAPDGEYAVQKLLRKHYRALCQTPSTVPKPSSIPVDTGDGGVAFVEGEIKEGSRDEVMAQIRSKYNGRPFTMPKT